MKITTSYAVEILHPGKQFQRTVEIYRAAVAYLIDVVAKESESVFAIAGAKKQMRIVECFIIHCYCCQKYKQSIFWLTFMWSI